jgi:hypothetical protein
MLAGLNLNNRLYGLLHKHGGWKKDKMLDSLRKLSDGELAEDDATPLMPPDASSRKRKRPKQRLKLERGQYTW